MWGFGFGLGFFFCFFFGWWGGDWLVVCGQCFVFNLGHPDLDKVLVP